MFADNHQNVGQLKVSNSALWCIECFIGPSSHFLGLLGNRTIRHRNIEMVQCKLLSHRYLLNMFHLFYSKNTSVTSVRLEVIIGGAIFFFYSKKHLCRTNTVGHFQSRLSLSLIQIHLLLQWSFQEINCYCVLQQHNHQFDSKTSLFREEISACTAVHTRHVMDACDRVRPTILLPPMMGTSFVLVALTGLIVSKLKHRVTWSRRTCVNFPFLRGERIQYLSVSA